MQEAVFGGSSAPLLQTILNTLLTLYAMPPTKTLFGMGHPRGTGYGRRSGSDRELGVLASLEFMFPVLQFACAESELLRGAVSLVILGCSSGLHRSVTRDTRRRTRHMTRKHM